MCVCVCVCVCEKLGKRHFLMAVTAWGFSCLWRKEKCNPPPPSPPAPPPSTLPPPLPDPAPLLQRLFPSSNADPPPGPGPLLRPPFLLLLLILLSSPLRPAPALALNLLLRNCVATTAGTLLFLLNFCWLHSIISFNCFIQWLFIDDQFNSIDFHQSPLLDHIHPSPSLRQWITFIHSYCCFWCWKPPPKNGNKKPRKWFLSLRIRSYGQWINTGRSQCQSVIKTGGIAVKSALKLVNVSTVIVTQKLQVQRGWDPFFFHPPLLLPPTSFSAGCGGWCRLVPLDWSAEGEQKKQEHQDPTPRHQKQERDTHIHTKKKHQLVFHKRLAAKTTSSAQAAISGIFNTDFREFYWMLKF